jgi:superoxide dismutase
LRIARRIHALTGEPQILRPRLSTMEILHGWAVQSRAADLDYQNARPKYLEAVLANLLNWDYAAANLSRENETVRAAAE